MYAGKERRNRVVALVLAVVLVAGVVLALLATVVQAGPAQAAPTAALPAHASLVSVSPADGAQLSTAPAQVQLTFDDVVSAEFAQIYLTRDGEPVETSPPSVNRTVVTAAVIGSPGPGAYRLLWQVTGEDGHRVPGESSFSVAAGAAAGGSTAAVGATPRVTPTYKTPQTQPTTFGHPDHLPGLVTAGILLLAGLALLVYEHRRRARTPDNHQTDAQDRERIS